MLAVPTLERTLASHLVFSSCHANCRAIDKGGGQPMAGSLDNPAERLPGNAHLRGGLPMVEARVIGQAEGLELVDGTGDFRQLVGGNARRFEEGDVGQGGDPPAVFWSGHGF
jgi:hypothetical protein